jgi:hypothetical protein
MSATNIFDLPRQCDAGVGADDALNQSICGSQVSQQTLRNDVAHKYTVALKVSQAEPIGETAL